MVVSATIRPLWLTANSLVYLQASISSDVGDITGYPVEMAITPGEMNPPIEADWVDAAWAGKLARIKVGPVLDGGQVKLEAGQEYFLWARVTTPSERPEIACGPFYTYGAA